MFSVTELFFFFVTSFLTLFYLYDRKGSNKYPPGPFGFPLVGNLLQLFGSRPEETFIQWAKKYGNVFSLKMGMENVVVIDDYKLIKQAFSDPVFAGKPTNEIVTFSSGGPYGVINSEGEIWETQRRFMLRNLRDFGFGKSSMETLIKDEIKEVLEHFDELEEQPMAVDHIFGLAVLNSLWTIAAGKRFSQKDPKLNDMLAKMGLAFQAIGQSGLIFAPWLGHLAPNLSGYSKLMTISAEWRSLFKKTVTEHQKTYSEEHSRDFIDQYLKEIRKTVDLSSSFYEKSGAGEQNLLAVVGDIFLAGSETVASVLNWAMLYLSSFPKVQEALQREIDEVIGNSRPPSLTDRAAMPYAQAVLMEVLRVSTLVPLGAPHTTMADVEFQGFIIPKGTWVFGNIYSVHRNPEIWGDPDNFRPERFLSPDGKTILKNDALMPFQTGKRQCLGESLARDTLFLYVASVFQKFHVSPDSHIYNHKFECETAFIRQSKPFRVVCRSRH